MSTTAQVLLVVATSGIFLVRFGVALYRTRVDGRAVEAYERRHAAELVARGRRAK